MHTPLASINVQRGRLYLLATLPPRPTKACAALDGPWRQQRISLRLDLTPANMKVAQRRLAELEKQLAAGTFSWSYWTGDDAQPRWRDVIAALHRQKVVLGRAGVSTWEINYMGRLKQIDPASPCTTASIERAMLRYPRESRSYKELHHLMRNVARLAGVPFPEVPQPTYQRAQPVLVPDDEEIVKTLDRAGPVVQWYLGMMATYGLRPHEIDTIQLLDHDRVLVASGTKTGERTAIACPPEWVERFQLRTPRWRPYEPRGGEWRPDITARWLWRELKRLEAPWRPYALRHAYAGRLWRVGGNRLDLFTAARLMGHSPMQHAKTYRSHVDANTIADAAERALFGQQGFSPGVSCD